MILSVHFLDPSNFTPHYCIGLGNGLQDIGVDTHLWTSEWRYEDLSVYAQRFRRHDVFFRLLQLMPTLVNGKRVRRFLKGIEYGLDWGTILAALRQEENPILHVQWVVVPPIDRRFWSRVKALGIPLVYTAHNPLPHDRAPSDVSRYHWFYQHADRIIVHSPTNRDEMLTYFPETEPKLRVVPFGEFSSFLNVFPKLSQTNARSQLGLEPKDQVVLFFGNIAPYKGLGFLIDAVGLLADELPDLKLMIAGKCTRGTFDSYEEQICQAGIADRVLLHLHHVPTSQNNFYFSACNVCVLPYVHASQSMTLFMAFANQKPVIVTRAGGLPDVVEEGKSGLVVQPSSAMALAEALRRFFGLSLVEQLGMGSYGKQKIDEQFNWQSIGKATRSIYQELISAENS
jgi:D-inositol-3-phosphate glycosyltransferase